MKQGISLSLLLAVASRAVAEVPSVRYAAESIAPPLGPFTYHQIVELSASGLVTGMAPDDLGPSAVMRPFYWNGGVGSFFPPPPLGMFCGAGGGEYSVRGMNNAGSIVGGAVSTLPDGSCKQSGDGILVPSVWEPPLILSATAAPGTSYFANDIDGLGRIVGGSQSGPGSGGLWPCLWQGGEWIPMPPPTDRGYAPGEVLRVSETGVGVGWVSGGALSIPVAWDLNTNVCTLLDVHPYLLNKVGVGSSSWIVGQDLRSERPAIFNFETRERRVLAASSLPMQQGWATACDAQADSVVGNGIFLLIPPGGSHIQLNGAVFHQREGEMVLLECDLPLDIPRVPLNSFGFEWMNESGQLVVLLADGRFWRLTPLDSPIPSPDFDCSRSVDGGDLAVLLGNWGGRGLGDLDQSGIVDGGDLAVLLGAWTE
jgi:hypothetical protein